MDDEPVPACITVVLVEDHRRLRRELARLLTDAGLRVCAAEGTVSQAFQAVVRLRPDVVVVDRQLPDGDGIALCADIRDAMPEAIVILHPTMITESERRTARRAGVDEVVIKSVRGQALLEALTRRLRAPDVPGTAPV